MKKELTGKDAAEIVDRSTIFMLKERIGQLEAEHKRLLKKVRCGCGKKANTHLCSDCYVNDLVDLH